MEFDIRFFQAPCTCMHCSDPPPFEPEPNIKNVQMERTNQHGLFKRTPLVCAALFLGAGNRKPVVTTSHPLCSCIEDTRATWTISHRFKYLTYLHRLKGHSKHKYYGKDILSLYIPSKCLDISVQNPNTCACFYHMYLFTYICT